MDSYVQTLSKRFALGPKPTYRERDCAAFKAGAEVCDRCVGLCPQGIYKPSRTKRPDYSQCTKCGLCAAGCPHGAIAPIGTQVRAFMMGLGRSEGLTVGCEQEAEDPWHLSLTCLAALSWEQIAIAALNHGIVLSTRPCGDCDRAERAGQIAGTLERARAFLGEELFDSRVRVLRAGDDYVPRESRISRRDLMTFFQRLPLDTALDLLPEDKELLGGSFYRAVLRDTVRKLYRETPREERRRYAVTLPQFTDRCYDCGLCARQCPKGALAFRTSPQGDTFAVTVDSWRCTACGVCQRVCREGGITGMGLMAVPHLDRVIARRVPIQTCGICGKKRKPSSPDGLCDLCRIQQKAKDKAKEGG